MSRRAKKIENIWEIFDVYDQQAKALKLEGSKTFLELILNLPLQCASSKSVDQFQRDSSDTRSNLPSESETCHKFD